MVIGALAACQPRQDVATDPRRDVGGTDATAPSSDVAAVPDVIAPLDVISTPDVTTASDVTTTLDVITASDVTTAPDVVAPADVIPDAMPLTGPADPSLRQFAPMSTSQVTSRRPTLHWLAPSTLGSLALDLCPDRDCTGIIETLHPTGSTARASADLRPGPVYWRLRGRPLGAATEIHSEVWQFLVPRHSAPVDTSWGGVLDVNLDGYRDVAAGFDNSGGNHVFLGGPGGLTAPPARIIVRDPGGSVSIYGRSVGSAGDVNGDGYADIWDLDRGAPDPTRPPPATREQVRVFAGGPAGLSATPISTIYPEAGSCFPNWAFVSSAGDLDGDGYSDVLVSDYVVPGMGSGPLCLLIYRGGPTGLAATPVVLTDPVASQHPILMVAAADFNGDGHADLATGASRSDGGDVRVYLGAPEVLPTTPVLTLLAHPGDSGFGGCLSVGDFNADGRSDLVVGAPNGDGAVVYVYLGTADGIRPEPSLTISGTGVVGFGSEVSGQGDYNADGFSDLLLSSPSRREAWILYGGTPDLATAPRQRLALAPGSLLDFGSRLSGAGDIDGDGHADAVVTASTTNFGAPPGQVVVFPGTATGVAHVPSVALGAADRSGAFGESLTP